MNETKTITSELSPKRPMICSADGHGGNAERFTPEQRADAIIHVLYDTKPPPMQFELRDSIAAEIREAVQVEREICARIAENVDFQGDWDCELPTVELEIRARNS